MVPLKISFKIYFKSPSCHSSMSDSIWNSNTLPTSIKAACTVSRSCIFQTQHSITTQRKRRRGLPSFPSSTEARRFARVLCVLSPYAFIFLRSFTSTSFACSGNSSYSIRFLSLGRLLWLVACILRVCCVDPCFLHTVRIFFAFSFILSFSWSIAVLTRPFVQSPIAYCSPLSQRLCEFSFSSRTRSSIRATILHNKTAISDIHNSFKHHHKNHRSNGKCPWPLPLHI